MLDIYSNNVTVAEQSPIPFNSTNVDKGYGIVRQGTVTIQFNKCGVYKVAFNATAIAGTADTITWLSGDDSIETVSSDTITRVAVGTVIIRTDNGTETKIWVCNS